ncbi:magnesium transporter NIPA-domain-containing protein [Mycena sp. CBHHK59/15]|nr:magnesium transporter NIPA-domain-containing protein [Mycena sp. CBHHK59/15]
MVDNKYIGLATFQVIDASPFLGFLFYCFTVLIFSLIMAYGVAPRHGRTNPLVYISIASLVGGVSVMFVKGFSVALKLTFYGENQFVYPSTYLFVVIAGVSIVVQLNYANKALDLFSVNLPLAVFSLIRTIRAKLIKEVFLMQPAPHFRNSE